MNEPQHNADENKKSLKFCKDGFQMKLSKLRSQFWRTDLKGSSHIDLREKSESKCEIMIDEEAIPVMIEEEKKEDLTLQKGLVDTESFKQSRSEDILINDKDRVCESPVELQVRQKKFTEEIIKVRV